MKTDSIMIILFGCIVIVIGWPLFLYGELLPYIFGLLAGILLIIVGVFRNKGYFNKNYYIAVFSVIALWGLMLLYIFLFRTNEYLENKYEFLFLIGLFVLLIISTIIYYIRDLKKGNLQKQNY